MSMGVRLFAVYHLRKRVCVIVLLHGRRIEVPPLSGGVNYFRGLHGNTDFGVQALSFTGGVGWTGGHLLPVGDLL